MGDFDSTMILPFPYPTIIVDSSSLSVTVSTDEPSLEVIN